MFQDRKAVVKHDKLYLFSPLNSMLTDDIATLLKQNKDLPFELRAINVLMEDAVGVCACAGVADGHGD